MVSAVYLYKHSINDSACHKAGDSDMVVQCGVDWMEVNATLKEKDIPLFFPVRFVIALSVSKANGKCRSIPDPLQR